MSWVVAHIRPYLPHFGVRSFQVKNFEMKNAKTTPMLLHTWRHVCRKNRTRTTLEMLAYLVGRRAVRRNGRMWQHVQQWKKYNNEKTANIFKATICSNATSDHKGACRPAALTTLYQWVGRVRYVLQYCFDPLWMHFVVFSLLYRGLTQVTLPRFLFSMWESIKNGHDGPVWGIYVFNM